jgi:hypothetical protein
VRPGSLRLVINDLYRDALPDVSTGFAFDSEVLKAALKRIYNREFNPMTELEENLFNDFWDRLNEAAEKGIGEVTPVVDYDDDFLASIRRNNGVLAAFKVHRMQNDMAAKLLDEKGELKRFEQWLNDVQPIADHQNRIWFRTEYDTAVKRAHQAAEWRQFEREAGTLPNLEWIRTTSVHPAEDHAVFWSIPVILPLKHPFWDKHRPLDRWGCKCSLRATDKPATPADKIPEGGSADKPAPGLDGNPAKDGILFSDSHPYNPPSCAACTLPGRKVLLNAKRTGFFNASGKKDCYHCSKPVQLIKKAGTATKEQKRRAKTASFIKAKNSAIQKVKKHVNRSVSAPNLQSLNFWDSKWGLKSILNHSMDNDEIKAAMSLPKNINRLKFIRISPMGEGKDPRNPVDVKNITRKQQQGIIRFNIYEYFFKGKTYYVKLAQNRKHSGYEELYTFTKKP